MSLSQITSLSALREWLREHSGDKCKWFGRTAIGGSKCILISDKPTAKLKWDSVTSEEMPLHPIELPKMSEVREWWFGLWEDEIVEHRYAADGEIACMAKAGTWNSLSPWGFLRRKEDFQTLSDVEFRRLVGVNRYSEMVHEQMLLGVSTRWLGSDDDRP